MDVRIITDDFTSATDGLVGYASMPGGAHVVLDGSRPDREAAWRRAGSAFGVSTESRHCAADTAAFRVREWASRWAPTDVLLKQFDSTLRGPLAAECAAAWQASGRPRLLVVPAFPAAGRTTREGNVHVAGVPVHRTAFAADPRFPVAESSLVRLFACVGVRLAVAANAVEAAALFDAGQDAVVVDAQHDNELDVIARCFVADRRVMWAGSTGIARALATVAVTSDASPPRAAARCVSPWVLVGSRHPASRAQAHLLRAAHPHLTVTCTPDTPSDPEQASRLIVAQAAHAVLAGACDGLIATGGETARALVDQLGAQQMQLLHEVEPGVPLGLLQLQSRRLPLITKAGGFGDAQTLHRCVQALTKGHP